MEGEILVTSCGEGGLFRRDLTQSAVLSACQEQQR